MAPYRSKSFRDADFEFRGRVLRGETTQPPRDQLVLDAINLAAGPMLAREYVSRYLPATPVSRAESIAGEVRKALAGAVEDRQRVVLGKGGDVRVELGCGRLSKK